MKTNHYYLINANVVDVNKGRIIPLTTVEINEGIITALGDDINLLKDVKVIDLSGRYLMPGLINMHVHLFGNGVPKTYTANKGKSQERILKFAATLLGNMYLNYMAYQSAYTQLLSGCTTIRAVGDMYYADIHTRNLINKGKKVGPRMLVSGFATTTTKGHGVGSISRGGETKEDLETLIDNNIKHGIDLVKICVTGGVMDATKADEPGEVRMSEEQTRWCVEKAHRNGLMVASHTESTEGVEICLNAGVDTIEHGAKLTKEQIERLKEGKSRIITTISPALPSALLKQEYTHYSNVQISSCKIVSDGIIDCASSCLNNGIEVGLGTDSSCPFASQSGMWRELVYFNQQVKATTINTIKAATITNAKILKLDDVTGSVEVNKYADLIIVKNNPFEDLKSLRNLDYVIVKGRIIKHPKPKRYKGLEDLLDSII